MKIAVPFIIRKDVSPPLHIHERRSAPYSQNPHNIREDYRPTLVQHVDHAVLIAIEQGQPKTPPPRPFKLFLI